MEYSSTDKLEIWSMSSTIKSQKSKGKWNMSTAVELYSHLPPLTDIKWGTRLGYEYFNGGSSKIQKDFLTPDFYLNCFFFFFFVSFNKRILLLILLTQTQQFRVLFFCCGSIVFVKDLVVEGESLPVSCVDI